MTVLVLADMFYRRYPGDELRNAMAIGYIALVLLGIALLRASRKRRLAILAGLIAVAMSVMHVILKTHYDPVKRRASVYCGANLSQIGKSCIMYSMDHHAFPASFTNLVPYGSDQARLFICPASGKKPGSLETIDTWTDYILVANVPVPEGVGRHSEADNQVWAYCKVGHQLGSGTMVLFAAGNARLVGTNEFPALSCDIAGHSRTNRVR